MVETKKCAFAATEIDEDISVEGMLHGIPARRPANHRPAGS
jgi:hypothetical protein